MEAVINSLQFSAALQLFLNTLVVTHLSEHYSVCVARSVHDDIRLGFPRPVVSLLEDNFKLAPDSDEPLRHFVAAIDAGCEGFVITNDMLFPFLDIFRSAHEEASFRARNRRIIAITQLDDSQRKRLIQHDIMEAIPNMLMVVPNATARTIEVYTTKLSGAEPRGITTELIRLERINLETLPVDSLPASLVNFPNQLSNMQGRRVRLSTLPYPPCTVVYEVPLGQGNARSTTPANYSLQVDGTEILMVLELCHRINCSVEIELVANSEWGQVYPNGSSDGLIGSLINRRSDVSVAAIYRWYVWYKYMTMSVYTGRSGTSCLVPRPLPKPFWQTPFLSFPPSLWLTVSVSFCFGATAVYLTERAQEELRPATRTTHRYQVIDAIFFMASLYVEQSVPLPKSLMAGSVLVSFLLFGGFMVGNSYAGSLAYVMTIPRYQKSIDTRADLAASGIKWSGRSIIWINSFVMTTQPELVTIRDNFLVRDSATMERYIKSHLNMGYASERLMYGSYPVEPFIDLNASRFLQPLKEDLMWEQTITACSKTWPLMELYDDLLLRVHQSGILRYWEIISVIRNMNLQIQRNLADARLLQQAENEPVKLTIAHFLGVFFILFGGLAFATLSFIGEVLKHRTQASWTSSRMKPILRNRMDPNIRNNSVWID
ncbi:uncharacterized protein LOC128722541 [Anopheles nili]|uniref:uncharacterized protein LOC128722541 n=1 Tax=Anopheles nili TaxID=185578 RepID=UPI00237A5DF9|nr:uncharacterized protein LOC128722541 [Anopheles nili]